ALDYNEHPDGTLNTAGGEVQAIQARGLSRMAKRTRRPAPSQARPVLIFGTSPEALPLIVRHLEVYRRRHRRGDGAALLMAIELCATCHVAPPNWAANAFFRAMSDWLSYRAATLDQAFHVQRSGNTSNNAASVKRCGHSSCCG